MKLGITGTNGLLGFHARCLLYSLGPLHEIRLANRESFRFCAELDQFVDGLDGVLHFAGVNRGDDREVEVSNPQIASLLIDALKRVGARPRIAFANSTHEQLDTPYGRGKRRAAELLSQWGASEGVPVANFILPHVFGEFGKPFYNSVVSTFCHQLANFQDPRVAVDGELELVHAQDIAAKFTSWICQAEAVGGTIRVEGEALYVSHLLARLRQLMQRYFADGTVPELGRGLELRLFNTLRSYLYPTIYPRTLTLHQDARGGLFEAVKSDQGGQIFFSTTIPGVTRGNHFHLSKIERFLVVGGQAVIRIRKLFSDEVHSFEVTGNAPAYIDIPTLHTHSITNVGDGLLQTLFWSNEIFDRAHPDTFPEKVL